MEVTRSRFRLAAPVTAVILGALGLALIAAWVLLICLTRDLRASKTGSLRRSLWPAACWGC
jgi:hypothetical protein